MRLEELNALMADPAQGDLHALATALGQRTIAVPGSWNAERNGVQCACGMLLAELPRPVWTKRHVVVGDAVREMSEQMTHAHVAPGVCTDCYGKEPCPWHEALMCDIPEPVTCERCPFYAVPGSPWCVRHTETSTKENHHR